MTIMLTQLDAFVRFINLF